MYRLNYRALALGAATLALALPALAQSPGNAPLTPNIRRQGNTHLNPPIDYPPKNMPKADPAAYWRSRFLNFGGGYCGGTVIVVSNNGGGCFAPWYYSPYNFAGYYVPGAQLDQYGQINANLALGGLQVGFQQQFYGPQAPRFNYYSGYTVTNGVARSQWTLPQNDPTYRRPAADASPARRSSSDDDDYYLVRKPRQRTPLENDPALATAVNDITQAFRTGNIDLLAKHVLPDDTLVLQSQGHTRKPLPAGQYMDMTREALKSLKTVRYDLDKVEPASNGAWMVYGTHVLRGEDGAEKLFSVGFVLRKQDGSYVVSEVSADPLK